MKELKISITLSENVDPQRLGLAIAIFVRSVTPAEQLRQVADEMLQQLLDQGITLESNNQ
jgi:hypothetical protein